MAYGFDRFLTTHTGSLPRPDDLIRAMYAKEEGARSHAIINRIVT
jgi:5-methyltetrahydropteroyltriglutamate--homocysteine methyltransferase